jgi:hypothetical protein
MNGLGALESKHSVNVSTSAKGITILQLPQKLFCCYTRTGKVGAQYRFVTDDIRKYGKNSCDGGW